MKQYKFLFKPVFFIFNLVFATWLVLKIEQLKPSDFGRHKHFFEPAPPKRIVTREDKAFLLTVAQEYKNGLMDSATVARKFEEFLTPQEEQKEIPADERSLSQRQP